MQAGMCDDLSYYGRNLSPEVHRSSRCRSPYRAGWDNQGDAGGARSASIPLTHVDCENVDDEERRERDHLGDGRQPGEQQRDVEEG